LQQEVLIARQSGYASNHQYTEKGLSAFGVALPLLYGTTEAGPTHAAICLAMPTARFRRPMIESYISALNEAARAIEAEFD
jgi:IclR family transcriptional regulator, acetate operon repressor